MSGDTRKLARLALLAAAALVFGYVESLFPPLVPTVPGIKLGLANTVLLYAVYLLGPGSAWALMLVKVVLSAALDVGFGHMLFSLGGGVLSLAAMLALRRLAGEKVSVLGVSVAGAACHNLGQMLVFAVLGDLRAALIYLPWLLIAAAVTGVLTGLAAKYVIAALSKGGAGR